MNKKKFRQIWREVLEAQRGNTVKVRMDDGLTPEEQIGAVIAGMLIKLPPSTISACQSDDVCLIDFPRQVLAGAIRLVYSLVPTTSGADHLLETAINSSQIVVFRLNDGDDDDDEQNFINSEGNES